MSASEASGSYDPVALAAMEEDSSRRSKERMLWALIGGLSLISMMSVTLVLVLIYANFYRYPIKQFLWTDDARAVCAAIPLTEPNISQARVLDFAAQAAVTVNSFDYINWRLNIKTALSQFFTPSGAAQYQTALQDSGILRKVWDNYQIVRTVTGGPPNLKSEYVDDSGRYTWVIEIPARISYSTEKETKSESRTFVMTVVRVEPSPINPNGIGVDRVLSTQEVKEDFTR